jgi:uncharacterized Zn finger protein (UPF0148 family)
MMTAHRCQAPGCGRFVRAGATLCRKHETDAIDDAPLDAREQRRLAFLERLETGEYAALFDDNLRRVITQAAQAMKEHGPDDEIGALRFVMARLMAEEVDPTKLATSVTRVVTAAVQAARARRAIGGEAAEGLTSALTQILVELDEG